MSDDTLQSALGGSAMSRAKPEGMRRNIEIAAANTVASGFNRTSERRGQP
jgi:hypothetical protein